MEYVLIVLAALVRVLPHPPNVTPVGAIALFGGAYLSRRFALLYPLAIMALSDFVLNPMYGLPLMIPETPFVYGSFLITGCLGLWCRRYRSAAILYLASLISSILFYLITNFGTWLVSGLYPKNATGLLQCYVMAIPFFRNSLIGNFLWLSILLGVYRLAHRFLSDRSRASA
ncbi:MAG: hypothetical protein HY590_01275 [Candidatus Omnitrophica bacterium]|nr:hypothetical protein [Candidatus Omnitrophota bacterium]